MKKAEEAAVAVAGSGAAAAPVPGFLAKLWALVEDPGSDDVICWSRNGQNFSILDEQRFAKELLPKYFKHNNLSSFIRQLNIYGFRKVVALENGMMTSVKNSTIEFQHPFFKREKFSLLANIKRKISRNLPTWSWQPYPYCMVSLQAYTGILSWRPHELLGVDAEILAQAHKAAARC